MKKIFFILIIFSSANLFAQGGQIKGKVISDKAQPIIGANVIVLGTNFGAAANETGFFEIYNLPYGKYTLQISSIGYEKKTVSVTISEKPASLTIVLRETVIETEQIIVSAGKYEQKIQDLTVSTVVIQPDVITRKNYQTFDEMLRHVPGVQMTLEQPSIRGSSGYSRGAGARVLVAINGIPIYSGDTGDIVWEMIPIADIERVEVIKGPASSLYGSTAIGGVINIITKSVVKNPITNFRTYIGGYDNPAYKLWNWSKSFREFYGVELTHSNSYENLGYTISLKKFDNNGYRKNDYFKRYITYAKLNYSFSQNNYLTFFFNFLNQNRGNFLYWSDLRENALIDTSSLGNIVKSNRFLSGLIYHHHFNSSFSAELKTSLYRTKFEGYGKEYTASTATLIRGEAFTNYKFSNSFLLTSGVEASYAKVKSNIFKNPFFSNAGAYAQTELKITPELIATIGLRYDFIKLDTIPGKGAFTPRAGLNFKLTKDFILRSSIGTGFRAPTPAEVFTSAAVGGGISVKENPNLTSEKSISFEAGANYFYSQNLFFDLAFYQTDYDNFIEPNLTKEGDIQFINLSRARIQGVELITDWSIIPAELQLSAGYNYMWSRDIEHNKAMKYRPRNILYAQVRYSPAPFDFGIDFRYWSKVEEIDFALTQPPLVLIPDGDKRVQVYVADVMVGYNFLVTSLPAKIYLNIKNIFNYNYIEFIGNIAPIRNASFSLELFF